MNKINEINEKLIKVLEEKIQLLEEQKVKSKKIIDIQNEQLTLTDVSQQRELFNAILDFSEELPMCTEDYHRGELWEKYKALNCG